MCKKEPTVMLMEVKGTTRLSRLAVPFSHSTEADTLAQVAVPGNSIRRSNPLTPPPPPSVQYTRGITHAPSPEPPAP